MKIVNPDQMKDIDRKAIEQYGIPGIVLMENAALKFVEELSKDVFPLKGKKIIIAAGKGNNGGDAFAVARHLYLRDVQIEVFLTCHSDEVKGDAAINLKILNNMGINLTDASENNIYSLFKNSLKEADAVVDGLFGTGLKGEISGLSLDMIKALNASKKYVISVDIPSGINGATGKIEGDAVMAYKTVTFGFPKTGLVIHPGCDYTGSLEVAEIGIPKIIIDSMDIKLYISDSDMIKGFIPLRIRDTSKGSYGKAFVMSGSPGMTGSGCLCSMAALRSGAGLVYLGVPSSLSDIYCSQVLEPVVIPVRDRKGLFCSESIIDIEKAMEGKSVIAIGPGISTEEGVEEAVRYVLENAQGPLIIDADALNIISRDIAILQRIKSRPVLTPHPGEMARLVRKTVSEVQGSRIETAREFSSKWNAIVVLKGSRTLIALPDGSTYINTTGNAGMATAGTGDVLTGMIAGLMAQGLSPEKASIAGVFLHGLAGDIAASNKGMHSIIASDVVERIPDAFLNI